MTSAKPPKLSTDSPGPGKSRGEWSLTREAFDKLLAAFSRDRDEAARQYEALRSKLIRFFEWRVIPLAESRADETLNRVARRIDEGQKVDNVVGYAYRVAYLVFLEALKEPELVDIDQETIDSSTLDPMPFEDTEHERRHRCFERCLSELTINNQDVMLSYFSEQRRARIERRRNLAEQLKITMDALRIRVHRMRKDLEKCILQCMRQAV